MCTGCCKFTPAKSKPPNISRTSSSDTVMGYTEEEIEGYASFEGLYKTLQAEKPASPVYLLFTGSEGENGKSWCPDCVVFESAWEKYKAKYPPKRGRFIRVKVGARDYWKDKECPFRTDSYLKLTSVPTLIKFGTPKRLCGDHIADPEFLSMLLEEE